MFPLIRDVLVNNRSVNGSWKHCVSVDFIRVSFIDDFPPLYICASGLNFVQLTLQNTQLNIYLFSANFENGSSVFVSIWHQFRNGGIMVVYYTAAGMQKYPLLNRIFPFHHSRATANLLKC